MRKKETFTTGSGDIFKDLGFSDEEAAALTIKASLFRKLQAALKDTGKTQKVLSEKLGIPQPKISEILSGKMAGFSVERIAGYLIKLGYDICLDTQPARGGRKGRVVEKRMMSA